MGRLRVRQTKREYGMSEEYLRLDISFSGESMWRLRAADLAPLPRGKSFHFWRGLS
jgi:hypothetical protein